MNYLFLTRAFALLFIASCASGRSLVAQSHFWFSNRVLPEINAPVFHTDCQTPLAGAQYLAALYVGPEGAVESELAQAGPPTIFRTGPLAGYWVPQEPVIPLSGGETGTFQVRVWEAQAGSFEAARAGGGLYGTSEVLTIYLTGSLTAPPNSLIGLESFCLVPEPSPACLLAAGGLLFMGWSAWRRRCNSSNPL
jgi:hypothetical protein